MNARSKRKKLNGETPKRNANGDPIGSAMGPDKTQDDTQGIRAISMDSIKPFASRTSSD